MKKNILSLFMLFVTVTMHAQVQPTTALIGSWTGKLNVSAVSLTLVLNFEQKDGYVTVTLDSPDQGAKGIGAYKDYLSDDSVAIHIDGLAINYSAKLKDDKLVGTFTQHGQSFPLVLEKGTYEVRRPQEPKAPFPYKTEEVTFRNERDGATLAGTLTYPLGYDPKQAKKTPVVLLVSGSGQQNRDEELMQHKPFLLIADFFARYGIATLRYDDRATGASVGGEVKNATTEDFMRDAAAGIDYLRRLKKFGRVGVLGHSEGAVIAFMLGAKKKVDFLVSLAGPGVKGDIVLVAQSNRILELAGQPANMTVELFRQQEVVKQSPWMQWFCDYDPSADISKTRCPVLALNGDRDCQVIASQNLRAIERLLPKNPLNQCKEYPALNHLFQHSTTGLPTEYSSIEETLSPEVLRDMAQWIRRITEH